jgi:predicted small metal-binding protein
MHEFQCGSPVCDTRFSAASKEELMDEVIRHVQEDHHIPQPTKPIVDFLEANTIREVPSSPTAG